MLSATTGTLVVLVTLGAFMGLGLAVGRDTDTETFTTARNSQGAVTLGLSFLAAGMGAWILFAPPEVGAGSGLAGLLGYAVGAALPVGLFALLGGRIRRALPRGHSLGEFVRLRYGRGFATVVFVVSLGYMFFYTAAELTAIAGVTGIVAGVDPRLTVIAVAAATLTYTAWGGLRASLVTDRWQAGLIVALLAVGLVAAVDSVPDADRAVRGSGLLGVDRVGVEVGVTLMIAVTAANMFHQGYWQRVWAATDTTALRRGAGIGIALTVPAVLVVGFFGLLAASSGRGLDVSPVPFFALTAELPAAGGALVLVLGTALVASSVDTLETGLASLVAAESPAAGLSSARWITVAMMVPAVVVGVQGYSVLRLLLIADLLCAAVVVPMLAGLWSRTTAAGASAGAAAGLLGAVAPGLIATGSVVQALERATFPGGVSTLPPFAGAVIASAVVTGSVSLFGGRRVAVTDLQSEPVR